MALKLWMGPSGSGKTRFLFEHVLNEAEKNPERNYIVIVPEQFTLSTQRELIRLSKDHGILNVDVLSFARLAYKIFEEVGFKEASGVNIDDMGKNLILRHLAAQNEEKLTVLGGNMHKLGYITEVKSSISEFMQYGINADKVSELIKAAKESGKGRLAAKLSDIQVLYDAFNKYIEDKYITKEEILIKASRAAYRSDKLKKSTVIFDGFTGFTPVQYNLIESLLRISHDIYVTILTDTRDKITYNTEHELFYLGYKTEKKLKQIAELNNIHIEKDFEIIEGIPRRYLINPTVKNDGEVYSDMLVHLERNLFREYSKPYNEDNKITHDGKLPTKVVKSGISVFMGLQPIDEVTKMAVEIQKLIRNEADDGGVNISDSNNNICIKYKDIAVATGDLENYAPIIRRVFKEYNIPFFIDKNQPVMMNPFIEYIRALVDVITENFTYSAVMRYLRSPLSDYETCDIDVFENFILKFGIKGVSAWNEKWSEKYSRYYKNDANDGDSDERNELIAVDIIREKVLIDLANVIDLITDVDGKHSKKSTKTVNEINAAFMRTFEVSNIENRLEILSNTYSETDDMFDVTHKKEYEKIYSKVEELYDRMSELIGDEIITLDEYGELLDAGFDEIRIGLIPSITDYIQIGDITRSRFQDIQALFIVGANDGVIPKGTGGGGIISDIEKEFLIEYTPDIELSPTVREQTYTGQLYMYMLMTKPKSKLYLSYSALNSNSESIRPSYIIKVVKDMFPDGVGHVEFDSDGDKVYNIDSLYDVIADNITDRSFYGLIELLINSSDYEKEFSSKLKILVDAAFCNGVLSGSDSISKTVAGVLYGKAIIGSVTRLEQYARCSFNYFLKYGLSLKEREIYGFDAKDMGIVFHSVIEKYSTYLLENGLEWSGVSETERNTIVENVINECVSSPDYSILASSSRYKYMVERISRIAKRTISVLSDHMEAGEFSQKSAELRFSTTNNLDSFTFKLSDDEILRLSGTIDRLDTYDDADNKKLYIKVIDYKSSDKSFDLIEVYRGLSLQLVVYMNAAIELAGRNSENAGKEIIPAGILYYHIDDPMIEGSQNDSDEEIYNSIMRNLRMKGLVNSDEEIYKLMDSQFTDASNIIPLSVTKKGELSKTSSAVSTETFDIISKFVNKKIANIGTEILSGNIKAEPHTASGVDADGCAFCEYSDICKFDINMVSQEEELINKENVIEKMKEEL